MIFEFNSIVLKRLLLLYIIYMYLYMFLIHNYILLRSYQYQVNLSDNETLVRVMIDDMEALDGLSGSSDDGNVQSQLFTLTQM